MFILHNIYVLTTHAICVVTIRYNTDYCTTCAFTTLGKKLLGLEHWPPADRGTDGSGDACVGGASSAGASAAGSSGGGGGGGGCGGAAAGASVGGASGKRRKGEGAGEERQKGSASASAAGDGGGEGMSVLRYVCIHYTLYTYSLHALYLFSLFPKTLTTVLHVYSPH